MEYYLSKIKIIEYRYKGRWYRWFGHKDLELLKSTFSIFEWRMYVATVKMSDAIIKMRLH